MSNIFEVYSASFIQLYEIILLPSNLCLFVEYTRVPIKSTFSLKSYFAFNKN